MSKRAVLRCDGSLEEGFKVFLEIRDAPEPLNNNQLFTEANGALPPAIELLQLLASWQQHYLGSIGSTRISLENISTPTGILAEGVNCRQLARKIQHSLANWLASPQFQPIEQRLRQTLTASDSIEILLRTNDLRLHRLPWHLWDFIERYPQAELLIGSSAELVAPPDQPHHHVRILAILGDCQGINIEADRRLLANIPQAEVVFLVEPSREELHGFLWEQAWDILFFAGHSNTEQQQGRIYLSTKESLTIEELRYGLRRAIDRGLKLAIFNSCDGLGLAYELEQLHIPHSIVMREPIPDRVALTFLQQFLGNFAGGVPLYIAVRQAREYLQGLEGEFPCASWLPIIFQNPASPTLNWSMLQSKAKVELLIAPKKHLRTKRLALSAIIASFAVTSMTMGLRYFGLIQAWELNAFDTLMRLRPIERPDPRLLIVTVTEDDVERQKKDNETMRGSLSDESLNKLLDKLNAYEPIAIGLDIYRDYDVSKAYPTLAAKLKNDESIVGVCKVSEPGKDSGVAPPPEMPPERHGFSDVLVDQDQVVRRHYLSLTPPASDSCQAGYGLSMQLALRYLAHKNIEVEFIEDIWKLGKLSFKRLEEHIGGYQKIDDGGHQIILNYRATPTPRDVAITVALTDVLTNKINPEKFKNRIILIGTTAPSFKDYMPTPYISSGNILEIPGVVLQGQMVSQLLSAALDNRPLIHGWTLPQDYLWVLGWAMSGGTLVIWLRRPFYLVLGTGIAIGVLVGVCLVLLQGGIWVPFIPSVIAIIGTESLIIGHDRRK
jgi:CHASE2 domain-containing sensor protein